MEKKVGSRIDYCSALKRESRGEDQVKTQQSSGVIFCLDEQGMEETKGFKIAFVPCSEHCDLPFSMVSIIPQGDRKLHLFSLLLVREFLQTVCQLQ